MKKLFTFIFAAALAVSCWGTEVVIGSGNTYNSNLTPYNASTAYSISQCIYTAGELSAANVPVGAKISEIAFKSGSATNERTWDVYIVNRTTDIATKWSAYYIIEKVTDADLFFSGKVNTATSGNWTKLALTSNFVWDGSSNICVTLYDKTTTSGSTKYTKVTSGHTEGRSIYASGAYSYNPKGTSKITCTNSSDRPIIQLTYSTGGGGGSTPKITLDKSSVTLGTFDAQYEKDSATFVVKGSDLEGDITLSPGIGLEAIPSSITKADIEAAGESGIIVKVRTTSAFAFNSPKVTVSSQNATSQTVTVSGTQASYTNVQTIPALYGSTVGSYSNFTESATIKSIEGNTLTIGTGSNTCHIDFTSVPGSYAANGTIKNIKLKTTGSGTFKAFTFSYTAPVVKGITIYDDKDNTDTIEAYKGQSVTVNINRSFVKDSYNTICLPFSISKTAFAGKFGIGSSVIRLASSSYNEGVISLTFQELIDSETLSAGTPYLIKPLNNVTNPAFENYTISADLDTVETSYVDFIGLINPTALPQSKEILFMGSGNELFWPTEAGTLKGLRCYFKVKFEGTPITAGAPVRMIVNKDNSTTELIEMQNATPISDVHKFVYNGQLIIIRNGVRYNINGQMIK